MSSEEIDILSTQFVHYIHKNYSRIFEHETIYDYVKFNNNYVRDFIPEFYTFIKEMDIKYELFKNIDTSKFIKFALAKNIEQNYYL